MTNVIKATWKPEGTWHNADSAPMCSFSERDEIFFKDESKWEFELPKGFKLFKTPAKLGMSIPVVGEKDGKEVTIGFACPVVFVMGGEIFQSFEACQNDPWFHPCSWESCRIEDVNTLVDRQKEMIDNECYGD